MKSREFVIFDERYGDPDPERADRASILSVENGLEIARDELRDRGCPGYIQEVEIDWSVKKGISKHIGEAVYFDPAQEITDAFDKAISPAPTNKETGTTTTGGTR